MRKIIYLTANQRQDFDEDFAADLASGVTISSRAVSCTESDGTADASRIGTVGGATSHITFPFVNGGANYEDYTVVIKATLSSSEVLERHMEVRVRNTPVE
jgi:hypothetical protein